VTIGLALEAAKRRRGHARTVSARGTFSAAYKATKSDLWFAGERASSALPFTFMKLKPLILAWSPICFASLVRAIQYYRRNPTG